MNTAQPKHYEDRQYEDRAAGAAPERPIVKSETSAKQAVSGQGVRYVLVWGVVSVVIAFAIAYFIIAAHQ